MNSEIFTEIKGILNKFDDTNSFGRPIISKFNSEEYKDWKEKFVGVNLGGETLLNDTTGENMAYTAFNIFERKLENVSIVDFFYIHKSILSNYFVCYIKSKILIEDPLGKIAYPDTIIVSPESIYSAIFYEANELILKEYPNALFLPFSFLKDKVEINTPFFQNRNMNYYEALFGYEGDILTDRIIGDTEFMF